MDSITELPELGSLRIIEVFDDFDGPRLFSCRDAAGRLYLALSVEDSRTSQTWLYVAVSDTRYSDLEAGRIDLRDAFLASEDGAVWRVTIPSIGESEVERLAATDMRSDWLPEPGELLAAS